MKWPIKPFLKMLTAESAALGLFVLAAWLIDPNRILSVAVGGLVFIIPSAYFTLYTLPFTASHESRWFLNAFSRGQTGKLMLAGVGFALVFRFVAPLHVPTLFMTYCTLMLVHVWVAARISRNLVSTKNDT